MEETMKPLSSIKWNAAVLGVLFITITAAYAAEPRVSAAPGTTTIVSPQALLDHAIDDACMFTEGVAYHHDGIIDEKSGEVGKLMILAHAEASLRQCVSLCDSRFRTCIERCRYSNYITACQRLCAEHRVICVNGCVGGHGHYH